MKGWTFYDFIDGKQTASNEEKTLWRLSNEHVIVIWLLCLRKTNSCAHCIRFGLWYDFINYEHKYYGSSEHKHIKSTRNTATHPREQLNFRNMKNKCTWCILAHIMWMEMDYHYYIRNKLCSATRNTWTKYSVFMHRISFGGWARNLIELRVRRTEYKPFKKRSPHATLMTWTLYQSYFIQCIQL